MGIHETWEDVHTVRIYLTRGITRPTAFADSGTGTTDARNLYDSIALNHDVYRSLPWSAGAIHDYHAAYDETLERAFAFVGSSVGRMRNCAVRLLRQ